MMKIPLFDVDGTLFKTGSKLHQDAFAYAFKKVYNIDAKQTEIRPEGMVDNQIIIEVLKLHNLSEEEIKDKIKLATKTMAEYFAEHKNGTNPEVLPGVREILAKLKERKIPIGVLTGNVEEIAWTKIEKAGIRNFFDFGAFGDKVYKRVELVEIARQNAQKALNKTFDLNDFLIIGDTAKDIKCARDAGIKVIAVATGIYPFEELVKEKPDLLVHTLEEEKPILDFISS